MDENLQEIKRVIRRRKSLLIITPILFIGLSVAALFLIEPKYASSTTILVQKSNAINPALLYQMDMGQERQMETVSELIAFESFITSRSTLERLLEDLGMEPVNVNDADKRSIVDGLRSQISITQGSTDSYILTFEDTDPVRAKRAVELLSGYYIETKTTLDRKRAQETIEYFTLKLDELENMIDEQRSELVSSTSAQIKALPVNTQALQNRLTDVNTQIETIDWELYQLEGQEAYLNAFLDQDEENFSVSPLYKLPLTEIPYGEELAELLDEYDEMNDNYTDSYPQLRQLRSRIKDLVGRIPGSIESMKSRLQNQRGELLNQRDLVISNMERSYVAEQRNSTKQSSFIVYQELYNEMKVKLEQAELSSELSERASGKYSILDKPILAEEPTSPNRNLVLTAGLFIGLIMGGLMIIVAELLDNTVRSERDFLIDKPIIAYLSDGRT